MVGALNLVLADGVSPLHAEGTISGKYNAHFKQVIHDLMEAAGKGKGSGHRGSTKQVRPAGFAVGRLGL